MLKPVALLARVDRRPAGAGAEGVQVLVNVEIAQRVRRPVDVVDPNVPREDSRRLVEGRRDAIGNLLLPVTGGVAGGEEQDNWEHGGGEATSGWTEWGALRARVLRTQLGRDSRRNPRDETTPPQAGPHRPRHFHPDRDPGPAAWARLTGLSVFRTGHSPSHRAGVRRTGDVLRGRKRLREIHATRAHCDRLR